MRTTSLKTWVRAVSIDSIKSLRPYPPSEQHG